MYNSGQFIFALIMSTLIAVIGMINLLKDFPDSSIYEERIEVCGATILLESVGFNVYRVSFDTEVSDPIYLSKVQGITYQRKMTRYSHQFIIDQLFDPWEVIPNVKEKLKQKVCYDLRK